MQTKNPLTEDAYSDFACVTPPQADVHALRTTRTGLKASPAHQVREFAIDIASRDGPWRQEVSLVLDETE